MEKNKCAGCRLDDGSIISVMMACQFCNRKIDGGIDMYMKEDKESEKPPLGTKPSWLQAEERIKELASAIERNAEKKNVNRLRVWIEELGYQCDILEHVIERKENEGNGK